MSQPAARRAGPRAALAAILCLNLLFVGAGALAFLAPPTGAQGGLPPAEQAVLEQVRQLVADPAQLQVRQRADGSYFADAAGALQAVILAATGADGRPVTRCVETLEEAAAFLAEAHTLTAAAPFEPGGGAAAVRAAVEADPALRAAAAAAPGTRFEIVVTDAPGEGFNDPTPAAPVAGNTGTTVGQQRLRAFEYAAAIWASFLQSTVPIQIEAAFDPLACSAGSAVLGSAGPQTVHQNFGGSGGFFPGAERPDTLYVQALANQRAGADIGGTNPGTGRPYADLTARFNSNLGQSNCLANSGWYYGFDGAEGTKIDLVIVLLHEFGHGLGFISTVDLRSGANYLDTDDIWNYYLTGAVGGGVADTLWKDMGAAERAASATSDNLVWGGPAVTAAAASLYGTAAPRLTVAGAPAAGPFDGKGASFGPPLTEAALAAALVAATDQDEDGAAAAYSASDACTPLTNAAAVGGAVALVDRGPCAYSAQVRNLQAAGAVAAIIADDVAAGAPPDLTGADSGVTIPAMSITRAAGDSLRERLEAGAVDVELALVRTARPGIDSRGRVKMYAPAGLQVGSSVSHFDSAAFGPDLLMEPRITLGLGQGLDLADELMRDIGWMPDLNYNGLDDRRELSLGVSQAAPSSLVGVGRPFTLTISARNQGYTTAGARLSWAAPAAAAGVTWRAAYSGGAAGPPAGGGDIGADLTLPPGSSAVFTVSATAPAAEGPLGASLVTLTKLGGEGLVDASGAADDSSSLTLRATAGTLNSLYLPLTRR